MHDEYSGGWTEHERQLAKELHAEQCATHLASTGCRGRHLREAKAQISETRPFIAKSEADRVRAERVRQGLTERVSDPTALGNVARILVQSQTRTAEEQVVSEALARAKENEGA